MQIHQRWPRYGERGAAVVKGTEIQPEQYRNRSEEYRNSRRAGVEQYIFGTPRTCATHYAATGYEVYRKPTNYMKVDLVL